MVIIIIIMMALFMNSKTYLKEQSVNEKLPISTIVHNYKFLYLHCHQHQLKHNNLIYLVKHLQMTNNHLFMSSSVVKL